MRHSTRPVFALAFVAALLPLGCGSDDDTATAKLTLTGPSIQAGKPLPYEFTCDDRAFGDGVSPELTWSNAPSGTKSYAILLKDLTIEAGESAADTNPEHPYHWTIWNIPGSTTKLGAALSIEKEPIPGAQQQNGAPPFITPGTYGYFGPCPNLSAAGLGAAVETHNDEFILYAFSEATLTPPAYDAGTDAMNPLNPVRQLANFFEGHKSLLAKAELKFTSDATPATCPGFPNPPFTCVPAE